MFMTDLYLDQFGSLRNVSLENLSPGMTLFWGPNGSGKSTVVRFLRGLLYGFRDTGLTFSGRDAGMGGSLRVRSHYDRLTLERRIGSRGDQPLTVISAPSDRQTAVRHENPLPGWVTESVYREVFSAGYEAAEQFDLVWRLCLETGATVSTGAGEVRVAEQAMSEIVREREGDSRNPGLSVRVGELRQRVEGLRRELTLLRQAPEDLGDRIRALVSEIESIGAQAERISTRLAELHGRISDLQSLLTDLRQRSVVSLDRDTLESEIRMLTMRLAHWRRIREAIAPEMGCGLEGLEWDAAGDSGLESAFGPHDSLRTIRVLVQRIEERVHALASSVGHGDWAVSSAAGGLACGQLQAETNALCRYLSQHELAVSRNHESLERLVVENCLRETARMEWLLEQRLTQVRAELVHCENVLEADAIPGSADGCGQPGHKDIGGHVGGHIGGQSGVRDDRFRTVRQVEDELARCEAERTRLLAERGSCDESRQSRRLVLERLQQEFSAAATLEQVDELRSRIAEAEARIELLEDRRRQLIESENSLREVIVRLDQHRHWPVLDLASGWLARLTQGECTQILGGLESPPVLKVQTIHSPDPLTTGQLSRGTRHQLALALRLALIRVRAETGEHVPLVLDDVFISSDDARATEAVRLLSEIAAAGQQIIFFTCQRDVRDLFERFHADVRLFGIRPSESQPVVPAPQLKAYVEDVRGVMPAVSVAMPTVPPAVLSTSAAVPATAQTPTLAQVEPGPVSSAPAFEKPPEPASFTNWLFYLETDHGVEDLAGISLSELEAFRSGGILTVGDLLQQSIAQIEECTRLRGFLLSAERLDALRGQAELACRVPMLRCGDAALLHAAGIRTVEELRTLRPETVFDRVTAFQKTSAGSRYRRSGRLIDRQQAINWARCGQHARPMTEAVTSRSRFSARGPAAAQAQSAEGAGGARPHRGRGSRPDAATSIRRRLISEPLDAAQRRAQRLARRRQLASGLRAMPGTDSGSATEHGPGEFQETAVAATNVGGSRLRFFLSRSSGVAAAPSVGPRTAESLNQLGVRTVEDLLSHNAEQLARKLNQSRITAAVIAQWQAQARLMCQVPELRGHDVQLLVACGLSDPVELARRNPAELLSIVLPFANSRAGERILRNGRKPDLAEVTDWIKWAGSARALRAA